MAVDLPFAILFFALIFVIAAPVAWVLVVALVVFMALAWRAGGQMGHSAPAERQSNLSREELLNELIAGRSTVKALALGDGMRPRWEARHAEAIAASQDRGAKTDGHQTLAHGMMTTTTVAMTAVGALAILGQEMTIGALIAANMLGGRMIAPMTQLVGQWRSLTQFRQAVARLDQVFALPGERSESPISLERPNGAIRLETVSFGYSPEGGSVLERIDGRIGPGGMHGIIGRNGCGKSTLLKIIAGLYAPDDGRVMLDDADIQQFTRAELSRWVGYMPQECVLFSGSIRDNIRIADREASDDAVLTAAKAAAAHPFIVDLPDGYAADVGEAGATLSRGQSQRIALARAFLGAPPVLLLDEPTSNLDNDAEREVAKALQDMARRSTVLVVTHSPALLAACGTLLVLDSGRVVLAGPAPAVLRQLQPQANSGTQTSQPAQSFQISPTPQQSAEPPRRAKPAKRTSGGTRKKSA